MLLQLLAVSRVGDARPGTGFQPFCNASTPTPYDWKPGDPPPSAVQINGPGSRFRPHRSTHNMMRRRVQLEDGDEGESQDEGENQDEGEISTLPEPAVAVITDTWQTFHVRKQSPTTDLVAISPGRIPVDATIADAGGILTLFILQRSCQLSHEDLYSCWAPRADLPAFELNLANSPDRKHTLYRAAAIDRPDGADLGDAVEANCNEWRSSFAGLGGTASPSGTFCGHCGGCSGSHPDAAARAPVPALRSSRALQVIHSGTTPSTMRHASTAPTRVHVGGSHSRLNTCRSSTGRRARQQFPRCGRRRID